MPTFVARRAFTCFFALAVLTGMMGLSSESQGAIYAPGDSVPNTSAEVFGWNRGDAHSTYNGWDFFEAVVVPGFMGTPFTDNTPDLPGQFGTIGAINVGPGALGVGSGNAYSPFAALSFNSIVPSGTSGGDQTRIVAQFRTGGSELDYSWILLSQDVALAGTIAPSFAIETGRVVLGGFGGDQVDHLAIWDLPSSQSEYRIDFAAASSSLSLQQFNVDTLTSSIPFVTPSAVPEPGSLALLSVAAMGLSMRRRRRRV